MFNEIGLNHFNGSAPLTEVQKEEIDSLLLASKAKNTLTAYQSDLNDFKTFCDKHNHVYLPSNVDTILLYISQLKKTLKLSTIRRRLSSISKAHSTANFPTPTNAIRVKEVMKGIERTIGNKQTPKTALNLNDLKAMIDSVDVSTLTGKRDKALILLGFSTASRRSELVSISVKDLLFTVEGMVIDIYEDKTLRPVKKYVLHQESKKYCPVIAVKEWLEAAQISAGEVFRRISKWGTVGSALNDRTVADVVKKYAELAGLDATDYSGHSLRSGLATSSAKEGYNDSAIVKQTRHASRTQLDRYVQDGNGFENNVTAILSKLKD